MLRVESLNSRVVFCVIVEEPVSGRLGAPNPQTCAPALGTPFIGGFQADVILSNMLKSCDVAEYEDGFLRVGCRVGM